MASHPHSPAEPHASTIVAPCVKYPIPMRLSGGELAQEVWPGELRPLDLVRRTLAESSWYESSVDPSRPVRVSLLEERVPKGSEWWIRDYVFTPYGYDEGGDVYPILDERFAVTLTYSFDAASTARGTSMFGQTDMEVLPSVAPVRSSAPGRPPFGPPVQTPLQNAQNVAQRSYMSSGGPLFLQQQRRVGPRDVVFSVFTGNEAIVKMGALILGPLAEPLAFIEARLSGYSLDSKIAESWRQGVKLP
jgi:hypothetical protein